MSVENGGDLEISRSGYLSGVEGARIRRDYITGCARMIRQGERLPDRTIDLVRRELGYDDYLDRIDRLNDWVENREMLLKAQNNADGTLIPEAVGGLGVLGALRAELTSLGFMPPAETPETSDS